MKRKKILLIVVVIFGIAMIAGGTYAYWTWVSANNTSVTFTATPNFSCSGNGGGNITSSDVVLRPTEYCSGTHAIKRTVTVTPTLDSSLGTLYLKLWLNVNSISDGLKNSNNFKYVLSSSSSSCTTGILGSGTFHGTAANSKVTLLNNQTYTASGTYTYYLYIWLDSAEVSATTQNQTFNLSLGGQCSAAAIS